MEDIFRIVKGSKALNNVIATCQLALISPEMNTLPYKQTLYKLQHNSSYFILRTEVLYARLPNHSVDLGS